MPLERDDLRHLTAAEGYAEPGMFLEAEEELERIDPEVRHVREVLELRVTIYRELAKWELMQAVAKKLAQHDPRDAQSAISWAYATRRVDSIDAARLILLNATELMPNDAMIHFNLACYECQLGNLKEARNRLTKALTLNSELILLAREDEDLKPIWDSLGDEG